MAYGPGLESVGDVWTFNMRELRGGALTGEGYDFDLKDYGVHFMWATHLLPNPAQNTDAVPNLLHTLMYIYI